MRSVKYNKDQFFKKMKKKPRLEEVISTIDDYSLEQIESLKGPQFPKWIREELVKYKNREGKTSDEMALFIANLMVAKTRKN